MPKILLGILFLLLPVLGDAQSTASPSSYQPATITQVKPYLGSEMSNQDVSLYEVSVTVSGTTYVVLTAAPNGESTIVQVVGRELLVQVGDETITWNDILGSSHVAPIIGRTPEPNKFRTQK